MARRLRVVAAIWIAICIWSSSTWGAELNPAQVPTKEDVLKQSLDESQKKWQDEVVPLLKEGQSWADLELANARKRFAACAAAFGDMKFCKCLNENIHFLVDFETYVRIISSEARPVPGPKTEEERMINSVFRSREQCVARDE